MKSDNKNKSGKISNLQRVRLLEAAVMNGSLQEVIDTYETYKPFELTARALTIAARYRGIDFVKALMERGARFEYQYSPALQAKYSVDATYYYLLLIPEKLSPKLKGCIHGLEAMNIPTDLVALSMEERIEIIRYILSEYEDDVSLDEMIYFSLINGLLEIADILIEMREESRRSMRFMFIDSIAWISKKEPALFLETLDRFCKMASMNGYKVRITPSQLHYINWDDKSWEYMLKNTALSTISKKKSLERAISEGNINMLRLMCESGWISNSRIRESLISYATTNKYNESLAWLLEYTNRTVDLEAETAKKQARLMRELNEDPNSVSALRKIWSYEKQEDGTLCITSYKGKDVNVVIPTAIGKAKVSAIGGWAFSPYKGRCWTDSFTINNKDTRHKIESVVIPESVTEIGNSAFAYCEKLTDITIPDSVTSIGTDAFCGCSNLTNIGIPKSVKVIDKTTFKSTGWMRKARETDPLVIINGVLIDGIECKGEVIIPDNVTRIADGAFEGCSSLTSVVISNSVIEIGYHAFSECDNLASVVIPSSVKSIGRGAFNECSSLASVDISEGVKRIGSYAFEGCSSLTSVVIPSSVKRIGSCAFDECSSLTSVDISEGVKAIEGAVFHDCERMIEITIPDSVTNVDKTMFGCWKRHNIVVHTKKGSAADKALKGDNQIVLVYDESTGWIRKARETDPLVIINGILIDGIKCKGEVIIPDNVTRIADGAFDMCSSLTSVVISNSVIEIGNYAFSRCDNLASVVIPSSVKSIGYDAFSECSSLTGVIIPSSVESIGGGAFDGCSSLTSVDISEGVKAIENCVFNDCEQLTEITIPDSVTNVDKNMFGYLNRNNIVVHTKKGSAADKVLKGDEHIVLVYDEGV